MKILNFTLIICLTFLLSSCLKTRTGVKPASEESSEEGPKPATGGKPSGKVGRYEIEEMKNEITRLSGKLEEIEHNQQTNAPADTREKMLALENRLGELEKNQIMILSEIKDIKDHGTGSVKAAPAPAANAKSLIEAGFAALNEKDFETATEKFEAAAGRGVKGKDAAEVHFGMGEAKMGTRDFKAAIVQYSKVQEAFAKSPRVPESLYKIGLCFEKLNMKKEARDFFSELIERFPKATEAKKARAKLK